MTIQDVHNTFIELGNRMASPSEFFQAVIHRTSVHNPWFTKEEVNRSVSGIAHQFLAADKLLPWAKSYSENVTAAPNQSKTVAIVMAGNIPLVGFHDFLCVLSSGHHVQVKLSDKDPYLMKWVIDELIKINPEISHRIQIVEKLQNFDAVIATGSNSSARYFEQYFGSYPHIIRKNRNGVALLTGDETEDELKGLTKDIFYYFGLGCRNVSKLYLPRNYNFEPLIKSLDTYRAYINHNKYKNNVEYNAAMYILNKVPNISLPHLIIIEDTLIASRIGVLHYEYYDDIDSVTTLMRKYSDQIQCLMTGATLNLNIPTFGLGQAQSPRLDDYADGVDTMSFLTQLNQD